MSDMFVACMYAARRELLITTPYFMPDEAIQALCGAPARGETTVVFPAGATIRGWFGNACRSTWPTCWRKGVAVHEYPLGMLHSKSMTIDGRIALVGSMANMGPPQPELNYENNTLTPMPMSSPRSTRGTGLPGGVAPGRPGRSACRPFRQRLVQNTVAMMAPVLL